MPCDSAGAGLISLGAIIKDFENTRANQLDGHTDHLLRHAKQDLDAQRSGKEPECVIKSRRRGESGKWLVSDRTDIKNRQLVFFQNRRTELTIFPNEKGLQDYYLDGEPPVQSLNPGMSLSARPYENLINNTEILNDNLINSYSGLCLAGRASGGTKIWNLCDDISFLDGHNSNRLSELLTIKGWHNKDVSRMVFYNSRTGNFDRDPIGLNLTIADSNTAFLKIIDDEYFSTSDIIAIMHRIMERDDLEDVGSKLNTMMQWYTDDTNILDELPPAPSGITIRVLKKK
tara:strand:- start:894 stop:1754 length:861 start_codon:yes stop_codon:yes gene_type:complete